MTTLENTSPSAVTRWWSGSDDSNRKNSGSAYIFRRDQGGAGNWGQIKKITALDADSDDCFGYNVSISGATVVVGAVADDDNGTASGSAYIFESKGKAMP